MAYTDTYRSRNRTAALAAVAALHIAAGYALVTGLASDLMPEIRDRLAGYQLPIDPPKPPPPTPVRSDPPPDDSHVTVTRTPFAIPTATPTFTFDPGPTSLGTEDAVGEAAFPTPTPSYSPPAPRFTPRGASPLGNPASWVSPDDYPTSELRLEHEGTTKFRLSIGTDGRVESCTVTGSSGWPRLDAAACAKLAARGRFKPATGDDGEKTAGSYASSVRWDIPEL
jgi:periplasmic protein TonB